MNSTLKAIVSVLAVIVVVIGASYLFGWIGVHQTSTIGAAREDAKREVFENSQSYIEGKRQEAGKLFREYLETESPSGKAAIRATAAHSFANFDEEYLDGPVRSFIRESKYGVPKNHNPYVE